MNDKIEQIIDKSERGLVELKTACDNMVNGQFISIDGYVQDILMIIAKSQILQDTVKKSMQGFDFKSVLRKSIVKTGHITRLILPSVRTTQIAFAVHLFYAFDTKQINVSNFLKKYFYSDFGITASYASFVKSIVAPFEKGMLGEHLSAKSGKYEHVDDIRLTEMQVKNILMSLYDFRKAVKAESGLYDQDKAEILTYIDFMGNEVNTGRYSSVSGAFSSLRNISCSMRLSSNYFENEIKIEQVLNENGCK